MAGIDYSAYARADLTDICLRLAPEQGAAFADALVDRLERRVAMLASHPLMGPARPEIGDAARSLVFERWLVFYRVDGDRIRVVRIIDGARDINQVSFAGT